MSVIVIVLRPTWWCRPGRAWRRRPPRCISEHGSGSPAQPNDEVFMHHNILDPMMIVLAIMTLSMMTSGTHSLAASSGLRTTYPRLPCLFKLSGFWINLTRSSWEGMIQGWWGCLKRKPSRGKTRSSPVQSSSQLPSHTGCSCEFPSSSRWKPCTVDVKTIWFPDCFNAV